MADYDISAAFAVIEDYLIDSMRRNMLRHIGEEKQLGINWSQWQAEMLKGLAEYRQDNEHVFGSVYPEINNKIDTLIRQSYSIGESEQEAEILAAVRQGYKKFHPIHDLNGEFFKLNRNKLEALISETTQSMEKAEYAALRMANDQYRKIIFGAQTFYNSGAGTLWKAVDMASKNFLTAGLNCIEYKNGARMNIASYAEMALRTANTRAYLHGEAAKREQYGIHTVIVNRHNAACPMCVQWQGRVFIDDVWGGGTKSESKSKGYPLLSEAIAGGLYHPNCKDHHTTYFEGVSTIPKPMTKADIAMADLNYKLEQERKYAERQAKKYSRLAKYSLHEDNQRKYSARAQMWRDKASSFDEKVEIFKNSSIIKFENFNDNDSVFKEITDESIQRIPDFELFTPSNDSKDEIVRIKELNIKFKQANKDLLVEAKKYSVGTEVSVIYDENMNKKGSFIIGKQGSVKIDDLDTPYHAFHNHPSGETFSIEDLLSMTKRTNMSSLIAIGNNSKIYTMIKMDSCNDDGYAFFLTEQMSKPIYKGYSYIDIKSGKLNLANLDEIENSELKQCIIKLAESCANEGEKFGYKYKHS